MNIWFPKVIIILIMTAQVLFFQCFFPKKTCTLMPLKHHAIDHALTFIHWLLMIIYLLTHTILTQPPEQNSYAAARVVLKNFANFKGKHLCWSLFFTKFQAFRPATLLKRDSYRGVFLWNLRNSEEHLFQETSQRLLLYIDYFIIYWFLQSSAVHDFHFYG